jgi:nucleotide-binding universal stress UspA family protein
LYDKILVPLDGSEHSFRALEHAIQIAKKFDSQMSLIHVYSVVVPSVSPIFLSESMTIAPEITAELTDANRKVGSDILEKGKKKTNAEGIQVEKLLVEGYVVEKILEKAKKDEFSLIVMGARGLGRMKEVLLGSVSHNVTRHAKCPVLVVK